MLCTAVLSKEHHLRPQRCCVQRFYTRSTTSDLSKKTIIHLSLGQVRKNTCLNPADTTDALNLHEKTILALNLPWKTSVALNLHWKISDSLDWLAYIISIYQQNYCQKVGTVKGIALHMWQISLTCKCSHFSPVSLFLQCSYRMI